MFFIFQTFDKCILHNLYLYELLYAHNHKALRLAGQAYFDKVLSEAAPIGGRNSKTKLKAVNSSTYSKATTTMSSSVVISSSSNSPSAQHRKPTTFTSNEEPELDDEDQVAFDAVEKSIEKGKIYVLLFIFIIANGMAILVCQVR